MTLPEIGPRIAKDLAATGMAKAEFARRIATSRQNVGLLLRKENMDASMLWRIGIALNVNYFQYLSSYFPVSPGEYSGIDKIDVKFSIDRELVEYALNTLIQKLK